MVTPGVPSNLKQALDPFVGALGECENFGSLW